MRFLAPALLSVLIGHPGMAQNRIQVYRQQVRQPFCSDYIEINREHKKVFSINTCGCILEEMMTDIGMSGFTFDGTQYTLTPLLASQHLFAGIKEYRQTGNDTIPRVIFIDINNDTVSVDSLVIFRLNAKGEIVNYRGLQNKIRDPKNKSTAFVFDMAKVGSRTHFTIPILHRVMQDDIVFPIPTEGKNTLVIKLYFPKYFHINRYIGNITYAPMEGTYKIVDDSLLVNKKAKIILKKEPTETSRE